MGFLDSLIPNTAGNGQNAPVPKGGGFLDNLSVSPAKAQPAAPELTTPFGGTAKSTVQVAKPGTPDVTDYLFNPKAETKIQPLGFTAEQAPTFTGPRVIMSPVKMINDFFTELVKHTVQGASDIYKLGAPKNAPANKIALPQQASEGFLPEGATDSHGKILSAAERTTARQKELDVDTPFTPGLNAIQATFEVGLPAAFNVLFTGDIAKGVTQNFLKKTGFQSVLGLKYSELSSLPTKDFVETVSTRTKETVREVADELAQGKITMSQAQVRMRDIGDEYRNIGEMYKMQDKPQLNKVGKFFEHVSATLNENIPHLGRDYAPIEGAVRPAEETLPGYRTEPGQAPAFGMSTERVEPVGFHDYQEPSIDLNSGEKTNPFAPSKAPESKIVGTGTMGDKTIPIEKGGKIDLPERKASSLFDAPAEKPSVYEGEKDLSIKTLEKLKGRATVSKKFIENLTNQPDLKQQEREVVRGALEGYPDGGQVSVADFAKKVKADLLPLKRGHTSGDTGTRYEHISLPDELKGDIKTYSEQIYQSPIKTSAGNVHYSQARADGYFGHTRVEDMADNTTRRVIEVQSDLYQKGRLEDEKMKGLDYKGSDFYGVDAEKNSQAAMDKRLPQIEKLFQYNDPTAHFRMVREEIKKAAEDGKTKLQFPTGETAMKIEGLGENVNFYNGVNTRLPKLTPQDLKVGKEVYQNGDTQWIITDVLGDGKFKAVPKNFYEANKNFSESISNASETFDISGKVDTSNPIYKFYEKDLGRYLTNKYGAVRVTDGKGVSWYEVPVSKDMADKPVEAFSRAAFGRSLPKASKLGKRTATVDEIKKLVFADIAEKDVRLIFEDNLIDGVAHGKYSGVNKGLRGILRPMIQLYQIGGRAKVTTAYHESFHYIFDNFMSVSEKARVLAIAREEIGVASKTGYRAIGYKGQDTVLEEWLANKYADYKAEEAGYEGSRLYSFFRKLDAILKKIVETYEKVKANIDEYFKARGGSEGGYAKNPLGEEVPKDLEPLAEKSIKKEVKEVDRLIALGKIRIVSREGRDVYQYKKGKEWVNARDEDSAVSRVTVKPVIKPLPAMPPEIEQKSIELEIKKQAVNDSPVTPQDVQMLTDKEGRIRELADVKSPDLIRKIEDRMSQTGITDPKKFTETVEQFSEDKKEVRKLQKEVSTARNEIGMSFEIKQKVDALRSDIRSLESSGLDATSQRREVVRLVVDNKLPLTASGAPLKRSAEGIPVALSGHQKEIVAASAYLEPTRIAQPVEGSYAEIKAIEILAREAESVVHGTPIPPDVRMTDILGKTITPVQKKVHIFDTYLRTPDRVMQKIGFGEEAKELRIAVSGYYKELPKNLEKIGTWAKAVPAKSNFRIFKYLDGEAVDLNPKEQLVAVEIKTWLREWANRLGLRPDQRISDYITRIFDNDTPQEFDEELAKIIAERIPGSVYNPFTLRRLGNKGYRQDTWKALEAYVKRGTRKVYMDPVLEKIQTRTGGALDVSNIEKSQFLYIKRYVDNINLRPTDLDESIDNFIKSVFANKTVAKTYRGLQKASFGTLPSIGQRPVAAITRFMRQMTFRGMIGLNLSSALRNLSQGVNTYAILGEKYTAIGYIGLMKSGAMAEIEQEGVLSAGFVQDKILSATGKLLEKGDKGMFYFFDAAEKINRGAAYFGAKSKYYAEHTRKSQGIAIYEQDIEKNAIEYAKEVVRKTQFSFDTIDTPVGMSSDIVKTIAQLQSFTIKQVEFLTELVKDKNYSGVLRYILGGLVFFYTFGKIFGMKPEEFIPMYRLGVPPSQKVPYEVVRAVTGAPDAFGRPRTTAKKIKDIGNAAVTLVPAGNQIKKSYEGYKAVKEGGSMTSNGRKQFSVGGTIWKDIQAIGFGKYANSAAEDYFNGVSASDREYEKISKSKDPAAEFTALKKSDPVLAKQVATIKKRRDAGITPDDEKIINLTVAQRAKYVIGKINDLETNQQKAALWNELTKKKILTKEVKKQVLELLKTNK